MKFTLSWLRDHLDTAAPIDAITDALTRIGLEVEGVHDAVRDLRAYVVASVVSAEPHPNADRLRVCMVDAGAGETIQVVCGAPNARAGMKSIFAPPGTFVPGKNLTLGIGTIRGVESRGMLVSAFELGLSNDHEGIIDLPADAPVGTPYPAYAGLDDPVIDVNLTPNRPDCASVRGIARDLAAAGLGTLKPKAPAAIERRGPCPVSVRLDLASGDEKLCPAFALRLVRGVTNRPSPAWMQRRLTAIGLRPINALVDITNYITFDHGRPLHVFDAAKVSGALTIRRARDGETLRALDGRDYALDPDMVVIADENGPESLAGIMGGEHSGVDASTTDVLIESALWDPLAIAQAGRRLGIGTDARYRFERGVDPAFALPGLDLATRMVLDLCGGEATEVTLAGAIPDTERHIAFPFSEVRRLTGVEVPADRSRAILAALGFTVADGLASADVAPPSWRPDVEGKADLVEEVIRIVGLDEIRPVPLPRTGSGVIKPMLTAVQRRTRQAKRALASRGLVEAVTWSFIAKSAAALFGGGDPSLALANPISADLSDMRPSLLPGLIAAAGRNADRGLGDVALFEVGQCFASDEPAGQTTKAAAIRRGSARHEGAGRHWDGHGGAVDAFDAKADAFALLTALGVPTGGLQVVTGGPDWLHPGRSARLQFGPKTIIGAFGELHPTTLKALDVKGPIVVFEITLDLLPAAKAKATKVKPTLVLSEFQPVSRDFAFVVGRDVAAGDILKAAQAADRQLVSAAEVFDIYEGAGIDPGKKSVAVAVTLQPTGRTLTDAEIDAIASRIVAEVAKKTGAVLRA